MEDNKAFYLVRSQQNDSMSFVFFATALNPKLCEGDIVTPDGIVSRDEFRVLRTSSINHPGATHRVVCERVTRPPDNEIELWFNAGTIFVIVSKLASDEG